ncbi:MAG TPA: PDC sensor domain-containing protein [Thermoanaerobaculia bacterium]|nr:PDC sensor domain-containing protein [Thermoanaerobaculia bacterium]
MRNLMVCFMTLAMAATALGQSAEAIQKALTTEATSLAAWGTDKAFVDAVKGQNAKRVALAEIKRIDGDWMAGKSDDVVRRVTSGPCADRLRALVAAHPGYGEAFVMDDQGALVCANGHTSDYWQGDESKWQRAFKGGKGDVFIDRPRYDDSAKAPLAQISVPVMDGGKAIGAITVGVNVNQIHPAH